jgi:hypothetical protein
LVDLFKERIVRPLLEIEQENVIGQRLFFAIRRVTRMTSSRPTCQG